MERKRKEYIEAIATENWEAQDRLEREADQNKDTSCQLGGVNKQEYAPEAEREEEAGG